HGEPVQLIDPPALFPLPLIDLSRFHLDQSLRLAGHLARLDAGCPFDLQIGPVFRAALVRLAADEHLLLLCFHHIACDGWSIAILQRELTALYEQFVNGSHDNLTDLPVQYADYALWQREWLQGDRFDLLLRYWHEALDGLATLQLPTDRPRSAVPSHRGDMVTLRLSEPLTASLRHLSRREGVTLYMTLLAAFQLLLARYAGQPDVVIGTDVANRTRLEIESLIGFFVNQLV